MKLWAGIALVCAMLVGCDAENIFTKYPCYLVLDNSVHQDATLGSAMNAMSPGVFCQIVCNESKKQYEFHTNYGSRSITKFNGIDERRTRALGMNDALIVGFGALTGEFYAYDRECPNCFDPQAVPVRSKALTMSSQGLASCAVCKRQYDMNNGGNCVTEGGVKGLCRYRCGTTGPQGVLSVGN